MRIEICEHTQKSRGVDAMQTTEIHDYARQLLEAHGFKAIAEAARKARVRRARRRQGGSNLETHRSGPEANARAARKLTLPVRLPSDRQVVKNSTLVPAAGYPLALGL